MSNIDGPEYIREETVLAEPAPVRVIPVVPANGYVENVGVRLPETQVRVSSMSRYEPDAIITAVVGLVLLVVGLIAIVRGGFDGPMSEPVVEVLGFTHTTMLGLIEIGIGALLLLCAASRSRSGAMFFGTVLGVAGFVGAVQTESFARTLALMSSMAWLAAAAGAVVVATAMLLPRFARRSTVVERR